MYRAALNIDSVSFHTISIIYGVIHNSDKWFFFFFFGLTLINIFACTGLHLREMNLRKPTHLASGWNNFENCWQALEKCGMSVVFIFPIYSSILFSALHCRCLVQAKFDAGGCLLYLIYRKDVNEKTVLWACKGRIYLVLLPSVCSFTSFNLEAHLCLRWFMNVRSEKVLKAHLCLFVYVILGEK